MAVRKALGCLGFELRLLPRAVIGQDVTLTTIGELNNVVGPRANWSLV
jgi:hypothetical protein